MTRTLLLSAATLAVLLDGYCHGLWTNRWNSSRAVEEAVARLERVPRAVGDWQAQPLALGAREADQAGFAGHWLRRYERRQDGRVVTVMLACGLPGPLSVHTPDVCYGGAGYVLSGEAVTFAAGSGRAAPPEFWKAKFSKPDALVPVHLRVNWSWRAGGAWKAPANPRWAFAGLPVLYKMYVTYELGADERLDDAVCAEFLGLLLPELEKALAAPRRAAPP
jgi:hypothetical protein